MKTRSLITIFIAFHFVLWAQPEKRTSDQANASFGMGRHRGTFSISYEHNWAFGKKRKLEIGLGTRFTSFLGANLNYITAPAELTSGSRSPLILFRQNVEANLDTILIKSPQANSFNLYISINYKLTTKVAVGFSIDAIGLSFGKETNVNFMTGNSGKITPARVTPFNILLISDNDRGTLNSDLYLKYFVNERWSIKAGGQFLFTEYTTNEKVQQYPRPNDRFRNKSLLASIGVSLTF